MYDVLAEAAAKNKIYVIGGIYEREGEYVYNTAFLVDRAGKLVGKYRKTHLHFPELFEGVRPARTTPSSTATSAGSASKSVMTSGSLK